MPTKEQLRMWTAPVNEQFLKIQIAVSLMHVQQMPSRPSEMHKQAVTAFDSRCQKSGQQRGQRVLFFFAILNETFEQSV